METGLGLLADEALSFINDLQKIASFLKFVIMVVMIIFIAKIERGGIFN